MHKIIKRLENTRTFLCKSKIAALSEFASRVDKDHVIVECGVAKGGSLATMAKASCKSVKLYGFDLFDGMPPVTEQDDKGLEKFTGVNWAPKGKTEVEETFKRFGCGEEFDRVCLVKGDIQQTLKENLSVLSSIGLLHVDVDWFVATKCALDTLYDLVVPGGVIVIDDYGWNKGCSDAVDQFIDTIKPRPKTGFCHTFKPLCKHCPPNDGFYFIKNRD